MANETLLRIAIDSADRGARRSLNIIGREMGKLDGIATGLATGGLALVAGGLASIGAGLAVAGKEAVKFGADLNGEMRRLQARTQATDEEMEGLRKTTTELFSAGLGQDVGEVGEALATVRNITQQTGEELQATTQDALALSKVFDLDIQESVRAADTAMDTFGLTSGETFDMVTALIQRTGDPADDLLDTINEYSTSFNQAGFTADQMLGVLESGLNAGARNFDVVADAVKEFNIRLIDGSDASYEALDRLGVNVGTMTSMLADGSITGSQAMFQIVEMLKTVDDQVVQNQIGAALFGTMWEDLGPDVVLALDPIRATLGDVNGATDQALQQSMTLGESWAQLGREFLVSMEPAAQEILPLLNDGLRIAGEFMALAQPIFAQFGQDLATTVGPAMLLIEDAGMRIAVALGIATEDTTGMDLALQTLKGTLDLVVTTIQVVALGAQALASYFEQAEQMTRRLRNAVNDLGSSLSSGNIMGTLSSISEFTPAGLAAGALGFAGGGGFTVGGTGGVDSQMVSFRASPGERVSIETPGNGGGGPLIGNLTVYASGPREGRQAADALLSRVRGMGLG